MSPVNGAPPVRGCRVGDVLSVMGTSVTAKLTGAESDGLMAVFEIAAGPGSMVPPRVHRREDETFYMLEGRIEGTLEGFSRVYEAGETVFLPRNRVHTWRTLDVSARFLVITTPAGMDHYFPEIASRAGLAPSPEEVLNISRRYGIEFV